MNKSEQIDAIAKALCAVQSELKPAAKNAKNPFFHNEYADLNSIWDSCRELLAKHGLSVAQVNGLGLENTVIIETVLMHESGQWISGELSLPLAKRDPQGVGSAITYGRRYGLAAILGIVADTDDDANVASGKAITANHAVTAGKQYDNSKPSTGANTSIGDIATAAQITLLRKKAESAGRDLDELIGDEFPDANGVGDLSKKAASYLIAQLEGK